VQVFDTVSQTVVPVGPLEGEARLYACGITPYDATHLGHAFTYVSVDLLVRAWRDAGLSVRYAQNITDVDDPLLERAEATGDDWRRLASEQTELYRSDLAALRVIPPAELTGVVDSVELVVALIEQLRDRGAVYQLVGQDYPDWYFANPDPVPLLHGLGVDQQQAREIFAERGGDPDRVGKRGPFDCLVWRAERPGEPAWDSPLGRGRPGWHVECTAIALDRLGAAFDVQAGGSDLAFPHHPMCAAEATALTGEPFATAFLHTAMVGLDGAKMSKSLGNLVFVSQLLADGHDPMAVRLVLLAQHYRTEWEYNSHLLVAAEQRLARWRLACARPSGPDAAPVLAEVRTVLGNDLDAPAALAIVDAWADACLAGDGSDAAAPGLIARLVDALLGVEL
jgi:L-cysteine:1D-myo-inositol 2-amino-2-deoxy-alpha-D-glucopyranoside ligase